MSLLGQRKVQLSHRLAGPPWAQEKSEAPLEKHGLVGGTPVGASLQVQG